MGLNNKLAELTKISVSKKLPDKDGLYIVYLNETMYQKNYYIKSKWYSFITKTDTTKYVTHWVQK